jgi:hypothetical protein
MWTIAEPAADYDRRRKRYQKKKPKALEAVLDNFDTLLNALNKGVTLEQVLTFGFVHSEPHGVMAIDQKGGAKLAQTRLYIFPDRKTMIIHPITLGDKGSQHNDILTCNGFVKQLHDEGETASHEPEKTLP